MDSIVFPRKIGLWVWSYRAHSQSLIVVPLFSLADWTLAADPNKQICICNKKYIGNAYEKASEDI